MEPVSRTHLKCENNKIKFQFVLTYITIVAEGKKPKSQALKGKRIDKSSRQNGEVKIQNKNEIEEKDDKEDIDANILAENIDDGSNGIKNKVSQLENNYEQVKRRRGKKSKTQNAGSKSRKNKNKKKKKGKKKDKKKKKGKKKEKKPNGKPQGK